MLHTQTTLIQQKLASRLKLLATYFLFPEPSWHGDWLHPGVCVARKGTWSQWICENIVNSFLANTLITTSFLCFLLCLQNPIKTNFAPPERQDFGQTNGRGHWPHLCHFPGRCPRTWARAPPLALQDHAAVSSPCSPFANHCYLFLQLTPLEFVSWWLGPIIQWSCHLFIASYSTDEPIPLFPSFAARIRHNHCFVYTLISLATFFMP